MAITEGRAHTRPFMDETPTDRFERILSGTRSSVPPFDRWERALPTAPEKYGRHRPSTRGRHYRYSFMRPPVRTADGPWWTGPAIMAAVIAAPIIGWLARLAL